MVATVINLLFGCRHRRLTRPMTAAHRPGTPAGDTYVVCLDCGKQFHYDVKNMRMGACIYATQSPSESSSFQALR